MQPVTVMRRVDDRGTNIYRIIEVNDISRKYCSGKMSLEATYAALKNLKRRQYSTAVYNIATVLVPMGFAPLWGGGLKEVAASAFVGGALALLMTAGKRLRAGLPSVSGAECGYADHQRSHAARARDGSYQCGP